DAAVDVDRGVHLGVAGIGDRNLFVASAVGSEHIGDRADQLTALGVAERAQTALAVLARVIERAPEIDALGRHRRELVALDRIDGPRLDALPAHPMPGQIALELLCTHGLLPGMGTYFLWSCP